MSADTFTSLLGLILQGTGNNNNTWGALLNSGDFNEIDLAIAGRNAQAVTGGTLDLSGSPPPAGPSGAIHAILDLSGTLASAQIVKVPNLSKIWIVNNACTLAGFTVTFKTPSGSASIPLPVGWGLVWCDGNNNIYVGLSTASRDIQMLAPDGTVALPGIAFGAEPGTGIRRKGTNDIVITIGGVDLFELTGAGAGTPDVANFLAPMVLQQAGANVVFGPASSNTNHFASFADATGTKLKDGGFATVTQALLAPGAAPLPFVSAQPNDNLHVLNDGTNPTRDINVTAGAVRDDANLTNLQLAATIYKRLDTAWGAGGASGAPAGACDTGTKGNGQTWHVYLIGLLGLVPTTYARSGTTVTLAFAAAHGLGAGATARVIGIGTGFDGIFPIASVTTTTLTYVSPNSGTVATVAVPTNTTCDGFDVIASQTYNSPSLPSGWTVKQALWSVTTDGSANIRAFTQIGDENWYSSPPLDQTNASIALTSTTLTLGSIPNGISVLGIFNMTMFNGSLTAAIYLRCPTDTDLAPSGVASPLASIANSVANVGAWSQIRIRTNTAQQIAARASSTSGLWIATLGWRDPRRRLF